MTLPAFGFDDACYAYGQPLAQGDFKTCPEDFVVEEVLGFEPAGQGEHLFLQLQTDDQNTRYTLKILSRLFSVPQKLISYSGLKDRRGLTSQWFSIHLPGKDVAVDADLLLQNGIRLLQQARHNKKLRIGTHKANRFHITLRNIGGAAVLDERLAQINRHGVPNYFGPQRFGHHGNNIAEALRWVERQELPLERELRSRVLSTLRAWLFNGDLSRRIELGTWQQWLPGSAVALDGSHSFFVPEHWDAALQQRYEEGDIHLGGWLYSTEHPGLAPDTIRTLLDRAQLSAELRPLRLLPRDLVWQYQGDILVLGFNLPTGSYATSVLRELLNVCDRSVPQASPAAGAGQSP